MAIVAEHVGIDGPAGKLQGLHERPPELHPGYAAVICHPHPQFQGTMLNKVVHTLSRSCTDVGVPALRFNYRGVGTSEGSYDDGNGETDDAAAAVAYMRTRYPGAEIVLAGFSFGAGVALRQSLRDEPAALVTVAPPVGRLGVPENVELESPWLLVQGGADELVDSRAVETWASQQQPPPQVHMLAGVSHFFHGNLTHLRQLCTGFFEERLSHRGAGTH